MKQLQDNQQEKNTGLQQQAHLLNKPSQQQVLLTRKSFSRAASLLALGAIQQSESPCFGCKSGLLYKIFFSQLFGCRPQTTTLTTLLKSWIRWFQAVTCQFNPTSSPPHNILLSCLVSRNWASKSPLSCYNSGIRTGLGLHLPLHDYALVCQFTLSFLHPILKLNKYFQ